MSTSVNYKRITRIDLESNDRLSELLKLVVARGKWTLSGENDVLNFFALAEKALHDDRSNNPGGLFRYLVEKQKVSMISDRNEEQACTRLDSAARQDIYLRLVKNTPVDTPSSPQLVNSICDPNVLGFLPRGLTTSPFPRSRPSGDMDTWTVQNSRARVVTVSRIRQHLPGFPAPEIPYGGMPRLIFAYLVGEAVRKKRIVDLGKTKNEFINRLGFSRNTANRLAIGHHLAQLSVCDISILSIARGKETQTMNLEQFKLSRSVELKGTTRVFERFTEASRRIFTPDLKYPEEWKAKFYFSEDFMHYVRKKPVPVRLDHLKSLSKSPRRMDLYTWLTNRIYYIKKKPVSIPLWSLHEEFAPEIAADCHRQFKSKLKKDLTAIGEVYQGFNFELSPEKLTIYASIPPVYPNS